MRTVAREGKAVLKLDTLRAMSTPSLAECKTDGLALFRDYGWIWLDEYNPTLLFFLSETSQP